MVGRPCGQVKGVFVARSWLTIRWHCSCVQTVPAFIALRHAIIRAIRSRSLTGPVQVAV